MRLEIFKADTRITKNIALFPSISAGFPSPADDYIQDTLDLNKHLINHPSATFFARARGESMVNVGIFDQDIIVIDRSIKPQQNDIVVCWVDGEFTIKRIRKDNEAVYLVPENDKYKTMKIAPDRDLQVWGVATYVIHKLK
jgi:DNA polymerase V